MKHKIESYTRNVEDVLIENSLWLTDTVLYMQINVWNPLELLICLHVTKISCLVGWVVFYF